MRPHAAIVAALFSMLCSPAGAEMNGTLRIGVMNDMSSVYSDFQGPGSVVAAQLAAEDFAKQSKRKVEILSADHQNKADVGASIARRWFDVDGVDMIIDLPNSAVALAVADIAREKNKVLIGSGAGSSLLTGAKCSPNTVHWTYDTWAMGHGVARGVLAQGGKSWFLITADYAFGQDLEKQASEEVKAEGGQVLGSVRHPLGASDFSSFLLQAQASGAQVIGLANAGGDTINAIKQAAEFGLMKGGQKLSPLLAFVTDIDGVGLETAQGLLLAEAFYWDLNDDTRAFSKRFMERVKRVPTAAQVGVYSSVTHYLEAVKAAGTTDPAAVMKIMKDTPINDVFAKNGRIREDGRMVHDMYLFEVKKPSESKGRWDDYKLLATIPGNEAFQSLELSRCPLVKK